MLEKKKPIVLTGTLECPLAIGCVAFIKEEGYDCVATRRVTRKGEPKIRSWFARQFYKLERAIRW